MSNKYSQRLLDRVKKSKTDTTKTSSKRAIQKTAEKTGDLIGNNIAYKITSTSNLQRNFIHKMSQKNYIQKQMRMK